MKLTFLCLVLCLCACQTLAPPDANATLRARERQILGEATSIARAASRGLQQVRATVELQETGVAAMQQGNAELLVTVRAGEEESLRLSPISLPQGPRTPGARWFAKTGLSRFISPHTGCVISPQISFTNDAEVLYVTLRAWNVRAGLQLSVQWWHESEPVHSEAFVLPANRTEECFWFSLTPDLAAFVTGSWRVQLYADGAALETPQSFTFREADLMMEG
ncbi:MAG: hypothetical protein OXF32_05030 [Anaerolineaceae bacterium]|nr:hypothetical protein [Anaerolineaceae bacterium]